MFSSFLKPKWQHKNSEVRKEAVSALDGNNDSATLLEVALNDTDESIKVIAIKKLTKPSFLLQIIKKHQGKVRDAAIDVYCHLSQSPAALMELIETFANDVQAEYALLNSIEDPDLAAQVLEHFASEDALVDVIINVKRIEVKKAALDRIESENALKTLKKKVSDKVISQAVRERLKVYKEKKDQEQAQIDSLQRLTESVKRMANIEEAPDLAQFTHLVESFENIHCFAKIDFVDQFEAAKNKVADRISKNAADLESLKQIQQANKQKQQLCKQLESLVESVKETVFEGDAHQLQLDIELIENEWQELTEGGDAETNERYHQALETIKGYAAKLARVETIQLESDTHQPIEEDTPVELIWRELDSRIKYYQSQLARIQWQDGYMKPPMLLKLESALLTVRERKKVLQQQQKEQVKQIDRQIRDLQAKIRSKRLKAANKLHNYLLNKVNELTESHRDATLLRLNRIAEDLEELKDWHQFATSPKRKEIVEQMRALQSKKMDPEARMKAIKSLQDEWKLLSAADFEQDQELWDEFKAEADKAFEPCAAYFAEQDVIRNENKREKQNLLDQVENFYNGCDWESVEWRQLDKIIRQARQEWNAIHNIPFKEAKSLNQKFENLMGKLLDKLNQERDKNLEARQEFVAQMDKILQLEDNNEAIKKALLLKQQWRELGFTYYKEDKKLWSQLQQGIDQLFERKRSINDAFKEELEAHAQQAQSIIDSINAITKMDDDYIQKSEEEFAQYQKSFEDVGKLPKNRLKGINQSFEQACRAYQKRVKAVESRAILRELNAIRDYAKVLRVAEIEAIEQGQISQANIDAFEQFENKPDALLEKYESIKSADCDQIKSKQQESESDCLASVLELEILTSSDSPEQYREQRTALQLSMLEQGLKADLSPEERVKAYIDTETYIHQLVGISKDTFEASQQRLNKVRHKLQLS